MEEKRDESVEEMAEKLEAKLTRKKEADDWEEIDLEGSWEEQDTEGQNAERSAAGSYREEQDAERSPAGNRREERVSKGQTPKGKNSRGKNPEEEYWEEYPEEDWEDEEVAPMKPGTMMAALAGVIVLAAVICAILWHFTHLERRDGELLSQSSVSAGTENSTPPLASEPDGPSGAGDGAAATTIPAADSEVTEPAATATTPASSVATPAPLASPASQASTAVQEPISGTTSMEFTEDDADVTPKDVINLRSEPSTLDADNIVAQAKNGEVLNRTGVNEATGWTRIEYNGETVYAVTQFLSTDLSYKTPVRAGDPNRVNTMDGRVILFADCSDNITPKEYVNLRTEPSTSEGDTTVRCQVNNGEVLHRTGYSPDSGWSRVEYNGEVLYVVSSLMYTVE